MRRRDFITLAGSAAAWPVVARAQQQGKKARIGFLSSLPDNPLLIASYSAFSDEMRRLGWVENQNLIIEYRYTNDPKADLAAQRMSSCSLPSGRRPRCRSPSTRPAQSR